MIVRIEPSWKAALSAEFEKPYFQSLSDFVHAEYKTKSVFPPASKIFAAFDATPLSRVKVVILGQDPYHGPRQANGLAFSVDSGVQNPPSLVNIFKEVADDLQIAAPKDGNLMRWAQQGVLLLNATLTVHAGHAGSHQHKGWEEFTDAVVSVLNQKEHLVFMLWGAYAQKKGAHIDRTKHLVLEAPHPSPLSAHNGFFGSRHFSQANAYLIMNDQEPIDW